MGELLQESFIETDAEYHNGVAIDRYKGTYSLVKARVGGGNDTVYAQWGYPQRAGKKEPGPVAIPWQIALGSSREEVISLLHRLLKHVK